MSPRSPGRGMRRPLLNLIQVASLLMLVVALGLASALITMHFAIHGREVRVPALIGMTVAEARSQTSGLDLNLAVDNRYYSSDVAPGHILTQSPPAGTVVRREWRVRVAESLGQQKVNVPDTVGADERMAALKLRRAGLAVGTTAQLPYAAAPEGMVLAQDPPANAQGIEGPSVNLLVAAPADSAPDGFVMPNLVGMPLAAAHAALARVGLKVAPPAYVAAPVPAVGTAGSMPVRPTAPGAVTAQQPAAGTRVDASAQVKLTAAQ